jgi:hypothetical protein
LPTLVLILEELDVVNAYGEVRAQCPQSLAYAGINENIARVGLNYLDVRPAQTLGYT